MITIILNFNYILVEGGRQNVLLFLDYYQHYLIIMALWQFPFYCYLFLLGCYYLL
jgi:hypothetical protein